MSKTLSESLFEKYCDSRGIRWRPVEVGASRTPDYDIFLRKFKVVTEVKEIVKNKEERQAEESLKTKGFSVSGSFAPGDRVRAKIAKSVPQIKARSQGRYPGLLVLFSTGLLIGHLDNYQVRVAMYGFETIIFSVPTNVSLPARAVGKKFGGKQKVTPEHNTSLSAVAVLRALPDESLRLDVYHNKFAAVPLRPELLANYGIPQYTLGEAEHGDIGQWVEIHSA